MYERQGALRSFTKGATLSHSVALLSGEKHVPLQEQCALAAASVHLHGPDNTLLVRNVHSNAHTWPQPQQRSRTGKQTTNASSAARGNRAMSLTKPGAGLSTE